MKKALIASIILLALAACHDAGINNSDVTGGIGTGGTSTGGNASTDKSAPLKFDGDVISCQKHADCTVLDLSCCNDFCDQSWIVAVNAQHEMDAQEKNAQTCSEKPTCAANPCTTLYPQCDNGKCTSTKDGYDLCDSDSDCTVVEIGCCDHCNGGSVKAVNSRFKDDVQNEFGESCPVRSDGSPAYECTLMACSPKLARCQSGRCVAYSKTAWMTLSEQQ